MLLRDWSEAEGRPTWLQVDAMCMDNILTGRDVRAAVTVTVASSRMLTQRGTTARMEETPSSLLGSSLNGVVI